MRSPSGARSRASRQRTTPTCSTSSRAPSPSRFIGRRSPWLPGDNSWSLEVRHNRSSLSVSRSTQLTSLGISFYHARRQPILAAHHLASTGQVVLCAGEEDGRRRGGRRTRSRCRLEIIKVGRISFQIDQRQEEDRPLVWSTSPLMLLPISFSPPPSFHFFSHVSTSAFSSSSRSTLLFSIGYLFLSFDFIHSLPAPFPLLSSSPFLRSQRLSRSTYLTPQLSICILISSYS